VSFTLVANLPPVSTTLAKLGGKFATGDAPCLANKFFVKIRNSLNGVLWGWGKKTRSNKYRDTVPLSVSQACVALKGNARRREDFKTQFTVRIDKFLPTLYPSSVR
jgi:hypothetical protein